jgi:hypothetical protein
MPYFPVESVPVSLCANAEVRENQLAWKILVTHLAARYWLVQWQMLLVHAGLHNFTDCLRIEHEEKRH